MPILPIIVVSVALTGLVYQSTDRASAKITPQQEVQRLVKEGQYGFAMLEAGIARYLDATRMPDGSVRMPEQGDEIHNEIALEYGYVPSPVGGRFTWQAEMGVYSGQPSIAVCMRPAVAARDLSQADWQVIDRIANWLPADKTVRASNCADQIGLAEGTHITYWFPLASMGEIRGERPTEVADALPPASMRPGKTSPGFKHPKKGAFPGKGQGEGWIPPGHGGVPPGQAKKD